MSNNDEAVNGCREVLQGYFKANPDMDLEQRCMKALKLLAGSADLSGKASGWAAGIIYMMANRTRVPVGFPNLLNADAEALFGVSMGTIRKRAAQVDAAITV